MADIFNTIILCDDCNKKTKKTEIVKEGFIIRTATCPNCNKKWHHPTDIENYKKFERIKQKIFNVKLRMVGNSYTISIPREIINFNNDFEKKINKIISLSLEEPEKLSIYFSKRIMFD
jgi:NMD protein affecting ribosome stability and mRNA decay|tara:strand:- start:33840 stop:34193 length:354 start_codon:yes stop_codon:yes gene_type:complete